MPTPPQPYINVQSGMAVGTINSGGSFNWYNSGGGPCTVTGVGSWCTASSYGPIAAGDSMSANVQNVPDEYVSFQSACLMAGTPSIHIHGTG
jgi:hypothetical protein